MYISFIMLILEYADIVWVNCSGYEKDGIENLIVSGATKSCFYIKRSEETKSTYRYHKHRVITISKWSKITRPYSQILLIPPKNQDRSDKNLRTALTYT